MEFLLCNDNLGDYDAGDIIDIHQDGFRWGTGECAPRFTVVRVPDAELDGDLEALRVLYLAPSVCKCNVCNKFMAASDVAAHLESVHADILMDNSVSPPRQKSPEEIGVVRAKNRKFIVDSQGFGENEGEISEKVFTNEDSELAFMVRKTVSVVVL
jgi:hypothetical protein